MLLRSGLFASILVGSQFVGCHAHDVTTKRYPDDLKVVGTAGGLLPGSVNYAVEISSDGSSRYTQYLPDALGPPLEQDSFAVSEAQLEALWRAIVRVDFFALEPSYTDADVDDGAFASLTVTAQGRIHRVDVQNVSVPRFDELLAIINRLTPQGRDLRYMGRDLDE